MKEVRMSAPASATQSGPTQLAPPSGGGEDQNLPVGKRAIRRRLLLAFGFQALAVLLGIALAFM
jgi:hypothetical protein